MRTISTDLAVVGSGPSGTAAACTVGLAGHDVVIIEMSPKPGGMSGGGNGLFAAGTREQLSMNFDYPAEKGYADLMEACHYMADARIVREVVCRSADTIEWLKGLGAEFEPVPSAYFPGAPFTWHKRVDKGMPPPGPDGDMPPMNHDDMPPMGMLHLVYDHIAAAMPNIHVMCRTKAQKLICDNGIVTGVLCTDENGEELRVMAKAVFLGTGGFAADHDMVSANTKYTINDEVFNFGAPTGIGCGVRMAWEAGAGRDNILIETIACMAPPCNGPGGVPMNGGILRQPSMLMLNLDGERFMNEETMLHFGYAGNAVFRQRHHSAFAIFDEETNRYYEEHPFDVQLTGELKSSAGFPAFMQKMIDKGYGSFFIADSTEELAEKTGMDRQNLIKTLDEYNASCLNGVDPLFFKSAKYLRPVRSGRIYAARFNVGTYGSMGGVRINYHGQAVTDAGVPIQGLYAGGFDANSIFGDTFPFQFAGIGSTFSFVYGRVGGESICKALGSFR